MIKRATVFLSVLIFISGCEQQNSDIASPISISSVPNKSALTNVESLNLDTQNTTESINQSRSTAITRAVDKAEAAIVSITVTELQRGYTRDFDSFFFRFSSVL